MSDDDSRTAPTRRSGTSSTSGTSRSLPAGAARPALPDPQHDRHVSFPDDQPAEAPGRPHPAAAALPAEAWAPRTTPSRPRGTSVARPGPPPPPTPIPRPRRRFPGWVAVLLVPPLLLGIAGQQTYDASGDCTGTVTQVEVDGTTCVVVDGPLAVEGVVVADASSSTIYAPFLRGRPVVAPVPADADLLTVEVVMVPPTSGGPGPVAQVETMVDGSTVDSHEAPVPYALDVNLTTPHSELVVAAAVTSGEGLVQCRVYAGSTLVAVNTSTLEARCTVPL